METTLTAQASEEEATAYRPTASTDRLSLFILTAATALAGIDYITILLFPEGLAFASVNRIGFFLLLVCDVLTSPAKYLKPGVLYIICFLIFAACLPFLLTVRFGVTGPRTPFDEFTALIGVFSYLIFFSVNCNDTRRASRVCVVLFCTSLLMVFYLLAVVLGITGEAAVAWRGHVQYTRASGDFDPNIVMLYLLPCLAFGPLLALHSTAVSGFVKDMAIIGLMGLAMFVVMQLNSRSGTVVLACAMLTSLCFRFGLARRHNTAAWFNAVFFVLVIMLAGAFLQFRYGIFTAIVAVYGETDIMTDTSFAARLISYRYLTSSFTTGVPNLVGTSSGYTEFWRLYGGQLFPHFTLLDLYFKGGAVFLIIYICLYAWAMISCLKTAFGNFSAAQAAISASFFAYLLAFVPMLMTLSLENFKMPWGIIGCAIGYAVFTRKVAASRKGAVESPMDGEAECPK